MGLHCAHDYKPINETGVNMVLSLWRAFALSWPSSDKKPVPRLDVSRMSDHDLRDLNLPVEFHDPLYRLRGWPFGGRR